MTVKAILALKGGEVLTIEPTTNLAAAAKLLAERKIGALVVTGADRRVIRPQQLVAARTRPLDHALGRSGGDAKIGRASCRERV